jgi:hypothetical protein
MRLYQVTDTKLRSLEARWRTVLNRVRGPIPMGLAIAHMNAESNGETDPTITDATHRPRGLMQISRRDGVRWGVKEADLVNTTKNLYVWCNKTNRDAELLHNDYAAWTQAGPDFWASVRFVFIVGRINYDKLVSSATVSKSTNAITTALQAYIRANNVRVGRFSRRDLRRIADHLDDVFHAMTIIDGPNKVSNAFTAPPAVTPGNVTTGLGSAIVL